jgi:hypothetical protein
MRPEDTPVIGGAIMQGLLQIMNRCSGKESGGVMEDALMAVSTLIEGACVFVCAAASGIFFVLFIDFR